MTENHNPIPLCHKKTAALPGAMSTRFEANDHLHEVLRHAEIGGTRGWSPLWWATIHTAAALFPESPTQEQRDQMVTMFRTLFIPCPMCRVHWKKNTSGDDLVDATASRAALFQWTVQIHNKVNLRLGRRPMTLGGAAAIFTRPAQLSGAVRDVMSCLQHAHETGNKKPMCGFTGMIMDPAGDAQNLHARIQRRETDFQASLAEMRRQQEATNNNSNAPGDGSATVVAPQPAQSTLDRPWVVATIMLVAIVVVAVAAGGIVWWLRRGGQATVRHAAAGALTGMTTTTTQLAPAPAPALAAPRPGAQWLASVQPTFAQSSKGQ